MNTPLVTIIMPAFNSEKTISESIHSVLSQSFSDWELMIITDAGTNDRTKEKVENFADSRIRFFNLEHVKSLSACRNFAIENAKGEWISFLDSDDIWLEKKLELQLQAVHQFNADFSATGFHRFAGENRKALSVNFPKKFFGFKDIIKNNFIGCSTVLLRKSSIKNFRFQDMHQEDFVFWLELLQSGVKAIGLQIDLVGYRLTPNSRSSLVNRPFNRWYIMRKLFKVSRIRAAYYFFCYALTALLKRI